MPQNNVWKKLKKSKPFISILAPMEDVTDTVFRQIIQKTATPDVFYTEFTSVEGLNSVGRDNVFHRLVFTEQERPLIAQFWGVTPQDYQNAGRIAVEMGFDGLDINMGCPVKKVIKMGACSALIQNHAQAKKIVKAARLGLGGKLPLSIKTRIGFSKIETQEWIGFVINELEPDCLVIHARTVKEESKVPNHFEQFKVIKEILNQKNKALEIKLTEKWQNLPKSQKILEILKLIDKKN